MVATCLPTLQFIEQTGCHFTTRATFSALLFASLFGCNMKSESRGGDVFIASERL